MSRLEDVIAQLHATRADLLAELERVERALSVFDDERTGRASGVPAGAQAAILATLRLRGGEPADIAQLLHGARSLGWNSASGRPRNVIASSVSKLARAGAVERIGEGRYRLTPANTDVELEIA